MYTDIEKQAIQSSARGLLARLGYDVNVVWRTSGPGFASDILAVESSDNLSLLIGAEGKNLEALEQIIHCIARKIVFPRQERVHFMFDINQYRTAQTHRLMALARQSVERVVATGMPESLVPMASYQRRIIHAELASFPSVATESIGQEPHRRVVIKPTTMVSKKDTREGLKGSF